MGFLATMIWEQWGHGIFCLYRIISGDSGNWWFHHKYANLFFCKDSSENGSIFIKGGSEKDIYIKSLKVNGVLHNSTWINWDELSNGATLEYRTSGKADLKWGTKVLPPSFP